MLVLELGLLGQPKRSTDADVVTGNGILAVSSLIRLQQDHSPEKAGTIIHLDVINWQLASDGKTGAP